VVPERRHRRGFLRILSKKSDVEELPVHREAMEVAAAAGARVTTLPDASKDAEKPAKEQDSDKAKKKDAPAQKLTTFQIAKRLARFAVPHRFALGFGFLVLVLQTLMELLKPFPLAYTIDAPRCRRC
jgi:hypothetical protein